jgi:hypothetical protein
MAAGEVFTPAKDLLLAPHNGAHTKEIPHASNARAF